MVSLNRTTTFISLLGDGGILCLEVFNAKIEDEDRVYLCEWDEALGNVYFEEEVFSEESMLIVSAVINDTVMDNIGMLYPLMEKIYSESRNE